MESIYEKAANTAELWQKNIVNSRLSKEKEFHVMMKAMLKKENHKSFLIELLDQSFRSHDSKRVAKQLRYLFKKYPEHDFFPRLQAIGLFIFEHLGLYVPWLSIRLFTYALREELDAVVLKAEEPFLTAHIRKRAKEHTTVNVNFIGESVLGEEEAKRRMDAYIKAIQSDDIHYVSIKISTIYSQITPLAFDASLKELVERLNILYTVCLAQKPHTFINLDMEAYSDLDLSVAAFKEALNLEHLKELQAGIVLQSYLPDAFEILQDLTQWAKERVKRGGSPIKIRLVKGANAQMEAFEARERGWSDVVFSSKEETDANYKKMMHFMLDADNAPYVHVGIASHNLFDQALAFELAKENNVQPFCSAEMLEGMSEAAYETLKAEGVNTILYAPASTKEDFNSAIAYLVRRFDENSAKENFMRHSFHLKAGSEVWEKLKADFLASAQSMNDLNLQPRRQQDREEAPLKRALMQETFYSEADTDFSLHANREWAQKIVNRWSTIEESGAYHAPCVIAGEIVESQDVVTVMDHSQLKQKIEVGSFSRPNKAQLEKALKVSKEDSLAFDQTTFLKRQKLLHETAHIVKQRRADLIGLAAAECGKSISESDVEVSEAVDFLEFYAFSVAKLSESESITMSAKGVALVITPWNFPIAIAAGGIAASLATGNSVLFKPASAATLVGYMLCQCFWDAGVSQESLQFIPASSSLISEVIISSSLLDFVIFTGSEKSAYKILQTNPNIHLSAETGGKNATIVTAMADRDQAIKHILHSAFSNSGQKCSASSLLILEAELYDDEAFKQTLKDAVASLHVGSIWDVNNRLGPLIKEPHGYLKQALTTLEPHEEWLISPQYADDNPYMLKPSLRWGTLEGDFCHKHELFGPLLSVMRADNLEHALKIANSTGYGLTSGIESLDEREQNYFKKHMQAGNLYINRPTTGAIVMRQPFGGLKKSSFGRGLKAGGLSYVTQFMNYTLEGAKDLKADFSYWYETFFSKERDYFEIIGESNIEKFLPVETLLLLVGINDKKEHVEAYIHACELSGVALTLGYFQETKLIKDLDANCCAEIKYFDKDIFLSHMHNYSRIRLFDSKNHHSELPKLCAKESIYIHSDPFVPSARIEMLYFFYEQSISHAYHRYGNITQKI